MTRTFPNFLDAYLEYANNEFIPPQFNEWAALSIIAGALERKVWLPWDDTFSFYPNVYVLLVSHPGDGKSVALNKAVDLLREMNRRTMTHNVMPNQVTEAKFIELMGHGRSFQEVIGAKEIIHRQNAGYYSASEASNSLRNIFGDFIACLTDFYDCPSKWERATKKDGKTISLENVCMNIIAGSTFDYLGKLVTDDNIMGGFASRLIYVVSRNKPVIDQAFQMGGFDAETSASRKLYREALLTDLIHIGQMVGPMHAEPDFGAAWEAWYPEAERKRRSLNSEKAQSVMARMNTNVLKVAMLLSAAESNDRRLKLHHWERSLSLMNVIKEQIPGIFRQAKAVNPKRTSGDMASVVMHIIQTNPGITLESVKAQLMTKGTSKMVVDQVMQGLLDCGELGAGAARSGGREAVILGNPDDHL